MNVSTKLSRILNHFIAIAVSTLFVFSAFAQSGENQQIVFEGSLTDAGGNAIDLSGATLVFYVSTSNCYLYGETTTAAGDNQGNISHRIGSASLVPGSPNGFTQNLFFGFVSGTTTFAGNDCTATPSDTRLAQVYYADENITATIKLGTVPYAHNATMLNGKVATDFIEATNDSAMLFYGGSNGQILSKTASGITWINQSAPAVTSAAVISALGYTPASASALTAYPTTSNNLSDLASATVARTNLGLGSLAVKSHVNLATEVSGTLPIAQGGSKWTTHTNGLYTVSNTSIGSTSVASSIKLYVEGNSLGQSAFFNNVNPSGYGLRVDVAGTSSSQYALNVNANGSSLFMVQNDGRIGIGTLNPGARVHFPAGTSTVAPIKMTSGTLVASATAGAIEYDGSRLYLTNDSNYRQTIPMGNNASSIDNITHFNSPTSINLVPNSGHPVRVTGRIEINNNLSGEFLTTNTTSDQYQHFLKGGSTLGYLGHGYAGYLAPNSVADQMVLRGFNGVHISGNAGPNLTVAPDGNVGIGTNFPNRALTVSGTIRTTAAVEYPDGTTQSSAPFSSYERVQTNCGSATTCMVNCTAGKKVISGGCSNAGTASLISSSASSDTQYFCVYQSGILTNMTAHAICVKF